MRHRLIFRISCGHAHNNLLLAVAFKRSAVKDELVDDVFVKVRVLFALHDFKLVGSIEVCKFGRIFRLALNDNQSAVRFFCRAVFKVGIYV